MTKSIQYRGFSIEQELNGTFTAYGTNSMYAQYNFKTVEEAKKRIDWMKD